MNNVLSVFLGGLLAITGSSVVKWLEYAVERRSLRGAFKAEIAGMLAMVERRGHGQLFEEDFNPVYNANVGRVGLLGRDVAGDVVQFYDMILGTRADLRAIINGQTRSWSPQRRAELMERNLEIFSEAQSLGHALIRRL